MGEQVTRPSFWVSGENAAVNQWIDGVFGLRVTNVLAGDPIQYLTTTGGQSSLGNAIRYEYQFTPINPLGLMLGASLPNAREAVGLAMIPVIAVLMISGVFIPITVEPLWLRARHCGEEDA